MKTYIELHKDYIKINGRVVFYREGRIFTEGESDTYVQWKEITEKELYDLIKFLSKKRNFGKIKNNYFNIFFSEWFLEFEKGKLLVYDNLVSNRLK
jgi:hypothetical protein